MHDGPTGQQPVHPSTIRAFSMIAKEEGVVRGLWRVGVRTRASLLSGSQLDVRCRKAVFVSRTMKKTKLHE